MPTYSIDGAPREFVHFSLMDAKENRIISSKDVILDIKQDKSNTPPAVIVLAFICNHCPYVQNIIPMLREMLAELRELNTIFIAINSNDPSQYPEDSYENMVKFIIDNNMDFHYFFDADQSIAKTYNAQCTPEFFVYNNREQLAYHGRFGAIAKNAMADNNELLDIVKNVAKGRIYDSSEWQPAMGCSIKWSNAS